MTAPAAATPLPPAFAALLPKAAPPQTVEGLPPEYAALLPPAHATPKPRVSTHAGRAASSPRLAAPARSAQQQTLPPEFAALLPKPTPPPAAAPPMTEMQRVAHVLFGKAAGKPWTWHSLWGLPDAAASIATGTAAQVAGGLAGLGDLAWTRNPTDAAQTVQRVENAFTYQPRTSGGQAVKHLVSLPFAELAKGANWAGGKVASLTGSPLVGALANAGIQGLPMLAGAELPELRAAPADVGPDVAPEVAAAREAGIKLTPTQAQVPGGVIGRGIESLTGTAKLERALSRVNAATVGRLAGEDLGIDGPLSRAALKDAKAAPNAVYGEVAKLGNVPVDDAFRQKIAAIANPGGGSFGFDTPADIARLKEGYGSLENFDAGDAVAKARQLRRDAGANIGARYNPMQQALGHAQRAVADALEDQLERHVAATGGPSDLLQRYRDARVQLAKINTVDQALRAGKGQVSALNLAKQLDRGAPLSGNLRDVAEAAQHFPRAMQDLSKIRDEGPLSALDLKLEGGLGILKPLAALKALPAFALPPVVRAILGSDLYQNAAFGPAEAPTPPTPIELGARALPAVAAAHSAAPPLAGLLGHMHWPAGAQLAGALAMGPIATESAVQRLLRGLEVASGEHGGRPPRPIAAKAAAAGFAL